MRSDQNNEKLRIKVQFVLFKNVKKTAPNNGKTTKNKSINKIIKENKQKRR